MNRQAISTESGSAQSLYQPKSSFFIWAFVCVFFFFLGGEEDSLRNWHNNLLKIIYRNEDLSALSNIRTQIIDKGNM